MVKNSENISYLQFTELILVYFNLLNNSSRVLYTFVTNKSFEKSLGISPKKSLKTFNSEISYNKVSFTDHNSKPLELTLAKTACMRKRLSLQFCCM